jgi:hypothetical protein
VLIFEKVASAGSDAEAVGLMFIGTLVSLALLEHWLLMLPLPVEKLFRWSLTSRKVGTGQDGHSTHMSSLGELKTLRAG